MEVAFRHAEEADLECIVGTYNATIPSRLVTADLEPVSVESRIDWFREHNREKRPLWIVEYNGQYAGWMSFSSFYGRPGYDGTVEVSIYLEERFRGKGIGKTCINKAFQAAPELNIHTLVGFIFSHNEVSLSLFRQMGFSNWALLPRVAQLDGVMRDLVIVGKKV